MLVETQTTLALLFWVLVETQTALARRETSITGDFREAGVVSVSRSFTLRFPPSHGASPPAGWGGPGFTALLFQRFLAPGGDLLGLIGRGGPGFTLLHTPLPSTPTDSRDAHSHDEHNRDHPG